MGLIVGFYLGSGLGGVWPIVTAGAGFIIGFIGDRFLMRSMHGSHLHSMPCCGGHESHSSGHKSEQNDERGSVEESYEEHKLNNDHSNNGQEEKVVE